MGALRWVLLLRKAVPYVLSSLLTIGMTPEELPLKLDIIPNDDQGARRERISWVGGQA